MTEGNKTCTGPIAVVVVVVVLVLVVVVVVVDIRPKRYLESLVSCQRRFVGIMVRWPGHKTSRRCEQMNKPSCFVDMKLVHVMMTPSVKEFLSGEAFAEAGHDERQPFQQIHQSLLHQCGFHLIAIS